jgi:hypothetical protein
MRIRKRRIEKQAYHPRFNPIEHKFVREVKCILIAR